MTGAGELAEELGETDPDGVPPPLRLADGEDEADDEALPDGVFDGVCDGVCDGVFDGVPDGVFDGVPLGVTAAGQVCDRLNHSTEPPSTTAEAAVSLAPAAEAAYACFSDGGPKTVITCVPPGSKVTVSFLKTVEPPGSTKCQPSLDDGTSAHFASFSPKEAAVRGTA
ncbi:hypothetical protein ACFCV9_26685 [Streptomyces sp. NPDC056367]|uniref:hypothetical protein n=1 Tax=Streptomyces sp. NPDC056367 TaxID=3345797 RepID=UPI0035D9779E